MFEDLDKKNSVINDNIVDITKPIVSSSSKNYIEKVDHLKETIFSNTPKPNKKQKFKKLKFDLYDIIGFKSKKWEILELLMLYLNDG